MRILREISVCVIFSMITLGLIGLASSSLSSTLIKSSYAQNSSNSNVTSTNNNASSSSNSTSTSNTTMSSSSSPSSPSSSPYKFEHGYPTASTVELAYNNTDLGRAIEAYKFFFPTLIGIYAGCFPSR